MEQDEILKLISGVTEINDIHEFMQDEQLDMALAAIIKLTVKPVPSGMSTDLIVKLQAISAKCATMARYYTSYQNKGPDSVKKKNTYYTMKESLDRLVDALKYSARQGF